MGLVDFVFGKVINEKADKAIAQKAALMMADNVALLNSQLNNALPAINFDDANYYNFFKTVGAVYEVTDSIKNKVLNCPIIFYKIKDKGKLQRSKAIQKQDPIQAYILKAQAIEEVDIDDLRKMLTTGKANPYQSGSQMLASSVLSFLIGGNTYLHPTRSGKKAKEVFCFPNMEIKVDPTDLLDPIRGYTLLDNTRKSFEKEEIQHVKTGTPAPVDNTMQYLYGVSALRAYLESLRGIKEGQIQASKQLKNGGEFGILTPKNKEDQFDDDQRRGLKEKLDESRKSNDEMARIFPVSVPLDWLSIGLSVGDLKLLEMLSANAEDIYRAYHWPLQFHNQKASTSNNQQTAVKQAIYDAVAPVCDVFGENLTALLAEGYGIDAIELDYTQLPEMAVNMKDVASYLSALPKGVLTYNEMRVVLKYGEKSEAYMNEHYVESGLVTLKSVYEGTATNNGAGSATGASV